MIKQQAYKMLIDKKNHRTQTSELRAQNTELSCVR